MIKFLILLIISLSGIFSVIKAFHEYRNNNYLKNQSFLEGIFNKATSYLWYLYLLVFFLCLFINNL